MVGLALRGVLVLMVLLMPLQNGFRGTEAMLRGLNLANVLFVLALLLLLLRGSESRPPAPLKGRMLLFFIVLLWGYAIGQFYDSSEWVSDLTVLKNNLFYMLLFFLFYAAVSDVKTAHILIAALLLITAFAVYLGVRQALAYGMGGFNETRRVAAPFSWSYWDANRSAIYYCISLPLFAAVALFCKSRPLLRLGALLVLVLGVFDIFFTYSRQAYFIIAAVALLLTLRRSMLIAAVLVIALLNFEYWVPESAIERVESTQQGDEFDAAAREGVSVDESTASRLIIWEGALELIQSRPWGIGLNHFKRTIGEVVPQYSGKDAHNFYVLITTEAGVVAPFVLLPLLWGLYRLGRRVETLDGGEEAKVLGVGFSMSVVAVALSNIYGSRFLDGDVMANFWIFSGIVARYSTLLSGAAQLAPTHDGAAALRLQAAQRRGESGVVVQERP
jgi:hypothetical protein